MIAHNKTIFVELQISEIGQVALTLWDVIHATKGDQGQVVVDFLADHPVPESSKLYDDLPNDIAEVNTIHVSSKEQVWQLFLDGASRTSPEEISL